jgi:hypothetical protein
VRVDLAWALDLCPRGQASRSQRFERQVIVGAIHPHAPDLRSLLRLLLAESQTGGPCGPLYAESLIAALATRLLHAAGLRKPHEPPEESIGCPVCLLSGRAGGATGELTALAAIAYPVPIRATGLGWAMGMARLGAAVGQSGSSISTVAVL